MSGQQSERYLERDDDEDDLRRPSQDFPDVEIDSDALRDRHFHQKQQYHYLLESAGRQDLLIDDVESQVLTQYRDLSPLLGFIEVCVTTGCLTYLEAASLKELTQQPQSMLALSSLIRQLSDINQVSLIHQGHMKDIFKNPQHGSYVQQFILELRDARSAHLLTQALFDDLLRMGDALKLYPLLIARLHQSAPRFQLGDTFIESSSFLQVLLNFPENIADLSEFLNHIIQESKQDLLAQPSIFSEVMSHVTFVNREKQNSVISLINQILMSLRAANQSHLITEELLMCLLKHNRDTLSQMAAGLYRILKHHPFLIDNQLLTVLSQPHIAIEEVIEGLLEAAMPETVLENQPLSDGGLSLKHLTRRYCLLESKYFGAPYHVAASVQPLMEKVAQDPWGLNITSMLLESYKGERQKRKCFQQITEKDLCDSQAILEQFLEVVSYEKDLHRVGYLGSPQVIDFLHDQSLPDYQHEQSLLSLLIGAPETCWPQPMIGRYLKAVHIESGELLRSLSVWLFIKDAVSAELSLKPLRALFVLEHVREKSQAMNLDFLGYQNLLAQVICAVSQVFPELKGMGGAFRLKKVGITRLSDIAVINDIVDTIGSQTFQSLSDLALRSDNLALWGLSAYRDQISDISRDFESLKDSYKDCLSFKINGDTPPVWESLWGIHSVIVQQYVAPFSKKPWEAVTEAEIRSSIREIESDKEQAVAELIHSFTTALIPVPLTFSCSRSSSTSSRLSLSARPY